MASCAPIPSLLGEFYVLLLFLFLCLPSPSSLIFSITLLLLTLVSSLSSAGRDYMVHNRAMQMFAKKAPNCKLFIIPEAYHELLCEKDSIREATLKMIFDFFISESSSIHKIHFNVPDFVEEYDVVQPIYSYPEIILRGLGVTGSLVLGLLGLSMIFTDRSKSGGRWLPF